MLTVMSLDLEQGQAETFCLRSPLPASRASLPAPLQCWPG